MAVKPLEVAFFLCYLRPPSSPIPWLVSIGFGSRGCVGMRVEADGGDQVSHLVLSRYKRPGAGEFHRRGR